MTTNPIQPSMSMFATRQDYEQALAQWQRQHGTVAFHAASTEDEDLFIVIGVDNAQAFAQAVTEHELTGPDPQDPDYAYDKPLQAWAVHTDNGWSFDATSTTEGARPAMLATAYWIGDGAQRHCKCTGCAVQQGTHQPAEALHKIAEPDAQHLQELRSYRITVENRDARIAELEALLKFADERINKMQEDQTAQLAAVQQGLEGLRWQIVHDHISGEYIAGRACFVVQIPTLPGANIMRGSVAEHFTKAVDTLAAQAKQGLERQKVDPLRQMLAQHQAHLEQNPYAYFELAYTRQTGWMVWITDKPAFRESELINPDRKVLWKGQGETPDEACENAALAAQAKQGEQT